jgi:4-amino-4-deoxy-L-arabinose transferase-like glycosyltransferase
MARRARALPPSLPLVLLLVVSVLSLGVRLAWIGEPCRTPCRSARDHVLVFDEAYYVNAARVIAGVRPPPGAAYRNAPLGSDPNAEHPQLAKLVIAGSIELFGDGPFAWRLGSIVFGSLAIVGMYWLVLGAGGGPWLALAAATLMALDNLLLVHSRIGTLDIYALAAMLWGAGLYLRRRAVAAGAVIGLGTCFKLVTPYVLPALALLELARWWMARSGPRMRTAPPRWSATRSLLVCAATAAVVFIALLAILDRVAQPYDPVAGTLITGGPFAHLAHMFSYAAAQSSPHGPRGIASYPWEWLVDYKPIVYLNIDPASPAPGLSGIHPAAHFLGVISPPMMLLALPALALAAVRLRTREAAASDCLGLAWFLGTFLPFAFLSLVLSRTSYLYYMVIVMPGLYLLIARLIERLRSWRWAILAWALSVVAAAIVMYPFTPLP